MKSSVYLEDDEMKGWLMAWSLLMVVGGFILGVVANFVV